MEVWPFLEHSLVSIPVRLTRLPHPHRQKTTLEEPPCLEKIRILIEKVEKFRLLGQRQSLAETLTDNMGAIGYVSTALLAVACGYIVHLNQSQPGSAVVGKQTMRTIHFAEYGNPSDVLSMVEVPVPSYRSWEVLVEVHAASINPVDYKLIQGAFFLIDFVLNHRPGESPL